MSRRLINYRSRTPRSFRQDLPERQARVVVSFSATPMNNRLPAPRAESTPLYGRRLVAATMQPSSRELVTA